MRLVRPSAALPVAAVLLAGSLAACSAGTNPSSDSTSSGTQTEQTVVEDAVDEAPANGLTPDNFTQRIVDAQVAAGTVHMDMTMGAEAGGISMSGDMVTRADTQDLAMSIDIPGEGSVQMRFVDGEAYMGLGEATQGKFIHIDPTDTSSPFYGMVEEMEGQGDPTQSVRDLDGAIVSVTPTGEEEHDGTPVTVYEVVADVTKMSGAMSENAADVAKLGVDEITYEYWLDADDLMHKVVVEVMGSAVTMEMSRWGEDLAVEAPDASELIDPASIGLA